MTAAEQEKKVRKIVVIGAGLTGLSTVYHLNLLDTKGPFRSMILEKERRPGGLCRTEEEKEFLFDYTGHLIHFRTRYFSSLLRKLLNKNLTSKVRSAWVFSKGVYTQYPFQGNLYGLPKKVVEECLYEFCASHFKRGEGLPKTFHDWILRNFGKGIARHFMVPYNQKMWGIHPKEMTCDWMGRFVPTPNLREVIRGSLGKSGRRLGYNSTFYYPEEGGIEELVKTFSKKIDNILCNHRVIRINLSERALYTEDGKKFHFDLIVSTASLTELVSMLEPKPQELVEATAKLKHVSVLNVNLGLKRKVKGKHWVYVPEEDLAYYRVGFPNNFSEKTTPFGAGSVYTEISYDPKKSINYDRMRKKVIAGLMEMGIISNFSEIVAEKIINIPYAYVIYDRERAGALDVINHFLKEEKILSAGRYGAWKYSSMEDAVLEGREIANLITKEYSQDH